MSIISIEKAIRHSTAIVFFIVIVHPLSLCQVSFEKSVGETDFYNRGNDVKTLEDGGYIIAGRTVSFKGGGVQAYLVKTDAEGNTLWAKDYGERGSEEAESVTVTHDGGYAFTGYTNSTGFGKKDVYLVRTNQSGDTLWTKTYGGPGIDGGKCIRETKDKGFVITGETYSYGRGTVNAYLIRTDEKGDTLWTRVYGGNGIEQGNSVRETADRGFILTGRTNSFGAGDYDVYLIRTDKAGKKIWMQTFGGSGSEEGKYVVETKDNGFIITGYTRSYGAGGVDVFLVRADKNGNQKWTQTFGGETDDYGMAGLETPEGGIVVSGHTNSFGKGVQVYLIKTDREGAPEWEYNYGDGSDDFGYGIDLVNDGGYVITGLTVKAAENNQTEKTKNVLLIRKSSIGE